MLPAVCPGLPASRRTDPRRDPYGVLGVAPGASDAEIKAAYRALVKQHHPDAGGEEAAMLALNAAWEVLGDRDRRRQYDRSRSCSSRSAATAAAPASTAGAHRTSDEAVFLWLREVHAPIDALLAQVLDTFPAQLADLAGDPYDDELMGRFCDFLEASLTRMDRVEAIFRSRRCPKPIEAFGLGLYQCLAQVRDALEEFERYTMGYVDDYLRDGRVMLREAARLRSQLLEEVRCTAG
jgi:molecular chaperone DnaJ